VWSAGLERTEPRAKHEPRFIGEHTDFNLKTGSSQLSGSPFSTRRWIDEGNDNALNLGVNQGVVARRSAAAVVTGF
jgi:hypothetical protein